MRPLVTACSRDCCGTNVLAARVLSCWATRPVFAAPHHLVYPSSLADSAPTVPCLEVFAVMQRASGGGRARGAGG